MRNVYKEENSGLDYLKTDNNAENLMILFHGYGASMLDLYDLSEAIYTNNDFDWVFPNGHLNVNLGFGMLGRAWFPVDMQLLEEAMRTGQPRDFSNQMSDDFKLALSKADIFLKSIAKKYKKVIIGGFSQGAMLTSHLSLMNSDIVRAYICYSGTLLGKNELVKRLESSKKIPFFQSHGTKDPVLGIEQAKNLFDLFKYAGYEGEFHEFKGAHEIPMPIISKSADFINRVMLLD